MPDREKVIRGLRQCLTKGLDEMQCTDCPYGVNGGMGCARELCRDALELLKAQEPIRAEDYYKPILNEVHSYVSDMWRCGACESRIYYHQKYCGACGKAVKWDGD